MLLTLDAGPATNLSQEKLDVTSRTLRLRRDRPELFGPASAYAPLLSTSPHTLGFVRGSSVATVVTRWPGLLARSGGWNDHIVMLSPGRWKDILTGAAHTTEDGSVSCAALHDDLPVALLVHVA
jgi:(1->4)-alpha-D-glucan 1-alpha-D-glucosylmutase